MKTYEYDGAPFSEPRSHPWVGSASDPSARHYDFTASPELIRSALEDFVPFRRYAAVEDFYALLERVNHPKSSLESADCAFNAPGPNETRLVKAELECSGRLMLLYRDLVLNTRRDRLAWLKSAFHQQLARLDPKFALGMVGTTLVPVRYLALPEESQAGQQLLLAFWAYGSTEDDVMQNVGRLFRNLTQAMRGVSARIVVGD
ncbi:MAG: hypothetical protein EOO73_23740 [Myxococcales bacterium]|nr:MAG: hypothetical protein EOO73_23740 [Myxococcales bacterium]